MKQIRDQATEFRGQRSEVKIQNQNLSSVSLCLRGSKIWDKNDAAADLFRGGEGFLCVAT